jgi:hypothetical protein
MKQKIDDIFVLSVINNELEQTLSFSPNNFSSGTSVDIETPLNYYLGKPDGTEVEGRSQVTSTDVADCIEWLMPSVMKAFLGSEDSVSFDPVSPEDEEQAELETQYVYDVLMKKNDGFVILHQMVKDALLQNNGICKIYYTKEEKIETKAYSGLTQEQLNLLISEQVNPQNDVEILSLQENTTQFGTFYDIKFKKICSYGKINVEAIPLENIKLNSDHNSINLSNARFVCHEMIKTYSDLIESGFDPKLIEQLPLSSGRQNYFRQQSQNEAILSTRSSVDITMQEYDIQESYLYMDYNNDGIAEYVKITTAGEGTPSHVLSIEDLPDGSPWISCTGILMSHKFRGLSIYDRIKEIQDQSTAVLRSTLDNFYLQNNQEKEVVEALVVDMDEVLMSTPGGIKRVKQAGAINPIPVQAFTDSPILLMRYLAEMKAGRTGVSADGPSAPQNIGDRVGSQGVAQLITAKEALSGLIISVLAETGLKPIYLKIRNLAHNHIDTIEDYKFKGRWVQVNPSEWQPRLLTTVKVGLGAGNTEAKLAAITQIQGIQAQLAASPFTYMLDDVRIYNTINEFCKLSGLHSAYKYVLDPQSEIAMQQKQIQQQSQQEAKLKNDEMTIAQLQLQTSLAQAELGKAEAMQQSVKYKAEAEANKQKLDLAKHQYEAKIAIVEQQYEQMKILADDANKSADMEFKNKALDADVFKTLATINANKDIAAINASKAEKPGEAA